MLNVCGVSGEHTFLTERTADHEGEAGGVVDSVGGPLCKTVAIGVDGEIIADEGV